MGIIYYTLITGHIPFVGHNMDRTIYNIKYKGINFHQSCWSGIPVSLRDLITQMLNKNPQNRPSIDKVLGDCYFTQVDEQLPVQEPKEGEI